MKKFHTLLAGLALCVCVLAACSSCKDDEPGEGTPTYDTTKGYTTNMASVKHGLVGRWTNGISAVNYSTSGDVCTGSTSDQTLTSCFKYSVTAEGGKFYITHISSISSSDNVKLELLELSKTQYRTKKVSDGLMFSNTRVTSAPNP